MSGKKSYNALPGVIDMKNYAASVRARLKNQMKATQQPLNLLELQYVQERFLYRLSQSENKDRFVLKGGTLFYVWSDMKYRPTRDLDFMFYGDLEYDQILTLIREICLMSYPEDGIVFIEDSFCYEEIKEEHEYGGVRIQFFAKIGTSKIPMKLDICTGDIITPEAEEKSFPKLLPEHSNPLLKVYPKATVIAEKVHAMITLDLANSRMKDYFDVFILIRDFKYEIDPQILREAISVTFSHRKTKIPQTSCRIWEEYFYNDSAKGKQWKAFLRKTKAEHDLSLQDVCSVIGEFITPIFEAIAES